MIEACLQDYHVLYNTKAEMLELPFKNAPPKEDSVHMLLQERHHLSRIVRLPVYLILSN